MATTTLYRFFDRHDRLLYVGIAGNPARRHHEHSKDKPWWADVARSTMEHFPTREEASAAEVAAIRDETPLHNVIHNTSKLTRHREACDRTPTIARSGRFSDGTPWWSEHLSILTRITADTIYPVGLTDEAVSEVSNHNETVIPNLRAQGYEGDIWHGPGPATPVLLTHTDDAPAALRQLERLVIDSRNERDREFGPDDLLGDP